MGSVLTPGRRRTRRTPLVLLALLVLAAGAAGAAAGRHPHGTQPSRPRVLERATPVATPASRRQPLVGGAPLFRHRFVPPLGARGAILVDASNGRVLWAWHEHARLPIASTTKIMTAVLALERLDPRQVVTVPKRVLRVPLVREGLRPGERVQVRKLLDGLLIYSGNDDAYTLARAVSGTKTKFVALMNARAQKLGLRDTHYASASGVVDKGGWSSAYDLAALARYAMRDALFREIVRTRIAHVRWSAPTFEKVYVNKNALLGTYRGADGVKDGWTTLARHCLVASAHRHGVRLIAVVLGADDAAGAARRLLNFGFARRG